MWYKISVPILFYIFAYILKISANKNILYVPLPDDQCIQWGEFTYENYRRWKESEIRLVVNPYEKLETENNHGDIKKDLCTCMENFDLDPKYVDIYKRNQMKLSHSNSSNIGHRIDNSSKTTGAEKKENLKPASSISESFEDSDENFEKNSNRVNDTKNIKNYNNQKPNSDKRSQNSSNIGHQNFSKIETEIKDKLKLASSISKSFEASDEDFEKNSNRVNDSKNNKKHHSQKPNSNKRSQILDTSKNRMIQHNNESSSEEFDGSEENVKNLLSTKDSSSESFDSSTEVL